MPPHSVNQGQPLTPFKTSQPDPAYAGAIQRVAIFANPLAGRGKGRAAAKTVADAFQSGGYSVQTVLDPPAKTDASIFKSIDAAIVIGGDGTLRSVAQAAFDAVGTIPPLLIIPLGTANLLARHLHIRWPFREFAQRALDAIKLAKISRLDAGIANGKLFLAVAGVGIDAAIVHEVDHLRRGPINYLSYLLPAVRAVARYDFAPLFVQADNREVFADIPAVAFIGNISQYGTGVPMLPDASPKDGLLDLCVLPVRSRGEAVFQFLKSLAGEHLHIEGAVHFRARQILIESPRSVPVQLDGDPAGHAPVRIALLPVKVPFILPPGNV